MNQHFRFDKEEVRDFATAVAVLTLGFTAVIFNPGTATEWGVTLPLTLILVGGSFLFHEISHRQTARMVNCYTRFKLWKTGVLLALLTPILGFVFAGAGGSRISSNPSERFGRWWIDLTPQQIAIVGMSGPLVNIGLTGAFALLAPVMPGVTVHGTAFNLGLVAAQINAYLATFTLLPIHALDGARVLRWNTLFWFAMFVTSVGLLAFLVMQGVTL